MNKLKKIYKGVSLVMITAIVSTLIPVHGVTTTILASTTESVVEADLTIKLEPRSSSIFNNGEFQGWGTSLCWWANRVGYSDKLTKQATKAFYNLEEGLGMNIGRYNIGGGDHPDHNHIVRTDSKIPGWTTNAAITYDTGVTTDAAIGYNESNNITNITWDLDPEADRNQLNVLKHAQNEAGGEFITEVFSNSPPYFMTNSGCSSGAKNAGNDNLRADCYEHFAQYLTDVVEYLEDKLLIPVQSISPMNEPYTSYWGAGSNKQEGCHFDQGESQSRILTTLSESLNNRGLDHVIVVGTDETSIDTQINSYNALSNEAKSVIERIDTHTYGGSKRVQLRTLAENQGKNLWMSEVDNGGVAGSNAGEMGAALWLAERITGDINGLMPSAWIMWNAIDNHIDPEFVATSPCDHYNIGDILGTGNTGYWGIAVADHESEEVILTKKYYAYGQYSRYIRPGYTIIASGDNTVAAYDKEGKKAVIVAINTGSEDKVYNFDLSHFTTIGDKVQVIRTSGDIETGENWKELNDNILSIDTNSKNFHATLKGNSITTYIVEDVTLDEYKDLNEISLKGDMVTGSTPWNNSSNVASKAVDGDITTFFDGVTNGYAIINLGKIYKLDAISYAARAGFGSRCVNASFYGSMDGKEWTKLYTIVNTPSSSNYNYIYSDEFDQQGNSQFEYRYIKYAVPEGDTTANCNIAEIKLYGMVKADVYEDITVYPSYLERGSLEGLPTILTFSSGDNSTITTEVTSWEVTSGDLNNLIGSTVTVTATLAESIVGYGRKIDIQLPVISKNLQYFIDCGITSSDYTASDEYNFINSFVDLKNKNIPDQEYNEDAGWGYTTIGGKKGYVSNISKLNATGYYGNESQAKTITYKLKLDAGTYEMLSGHYEWWNTSNRVTTVKLSYKNDGEIIEKTLGSISFAKDTMGSTGTVGGTFVVPEDNTIVTIEFAKGKGSVEDGVVSYFVIDQLSSMGVDRTELQELYSSYASVKTNDIYTQDSWLDLQAALVKAKNLLDAENPTKAQLTTAISELKKASDNLELLSIDKLDQNVLATYGNILYLVNCGNESNANHIPTGYTKHGYYQSNAEQKNKVDPDKGTKWGYVENDSTITYGYSGDGEELADTRRFNSPTVIYDKNETGIYYNFQLHNFWYSINMYISYR